MDAWDAVAWSLFEYGESDLGHGARKKRLVKVAAEMMRSPATSLPKAIPDPYQAKGAYRFFSNPQVDHDMILSGHVMRTAERCLRHRQVLLLQDTTTLSFKYRDVFGLGPI